MAQPPHREGSGWVAPGPPQAGPPPGGSYPFPAPPAFAPQRPKTNGFAVAALVTGLLAMLLFAVIFAIVALVQISQRGERGRGLAIGGLVAAVGWAVALVAASAGGAFGTAGGSADDEGSVFQLFPKAGQCFDLTSENNVDHKVVSCRRPHDAEMILIFTLPKGSWRGERETSRSGYEGCEQRIFQRFRTRTPVDNGEISVMYPTKIAWKIGDRRVHCAIEARAGEKFTAPIGAGTGLREWSEMKAGDCFSSAQHEHADSVKLVPCGTPHNGQLTHIFTVPPGRYPGERALDRTADKGCVARWGKLLGKHPSPVPVKQWYRHPSEKSWALGDRSVLCYVMATKDALKRSLLAR